MFLRYLDGIRSRFGSFGVPCHSVLSALPEVRLAKDKKTGKAKGFAVVEFTEPGAVAKVRRATGHRHR